MIRRATDSHALVHTLECNTSPAFVITVSIFIALSIWFFIAALPKLAICTFHERTSVNTFFSETGLPIIRAVTVLSAISAGTIFSITFLFSLADERDFMAWLVKVVDNVFFHTGLATSDKIPFRSIGCDSADFWIRSSNIIDDRTFLNCWSFVWIAFDNLPFRILLSRAKVLRNTLSLETNLIIFTVPVSLALLIFWNAFSPFADESGSASYSCTLVHALISQTYFKRLALFI